VGIQAPRPSESRVTNASSRFFPCFAAVDRYSAAGDYAPFLLGVVLHDAALALPPHPSWTSPARAPGAIPHPVVVAPPGPMQRPPAKSSPQTLRRGAAGRTQPAASADARRGQFRQARRLPETVASLLSSAAAAICSRT
jgi:hypothetical protein